MTSRAPSLGPRGEGWVIAQLGLFTIIVGAGLRAIPTNVPGDGWGLIRIGTGMLCIGIGLAVVIWGVVGLRTAVTPFPRPVADAPLIESGAYRHIRHPIYSGLVLASLGWCLVTGSVAALAATGLLFLLFLGKSIREEAWLAEAHPAYHAYQRRTKRLIPWVL